MSPVWPPAAARVWSHIPPQFFLPMSGLGWIEVPVHGSGSASGFVGSSFDRLLLDVWSTALKPRFGVLAVS